MTDKQKEAIEIIRKIKKDNESKSMIICNNTSNIQIRWSNKDLKEMAEITNRCAKENRAIETVLNLIQTQQAEIETKENEKQIHIKLEQQYKKEYLDTKEELEKKDKMIDEIQKEVRDHIGFENRLKRDNKEPDLFNQGRFYVANNINNILKGKVENGN